MVEFSSYLEKAKSVVKEIGVEVLKIYEQDFSAEEKTDRTPVTQADLISEKMLIEGLVQEDEGLITEETETELPREESLIWVFDPLDGTKDFINKTGEFSIMVGLLKDNEPYVGVIYEPVSGKLYFAEKGKGAYLEEQGEVKKLQVSPKEDPSDFIMVNSRNHFRESEKKIAETFGITQFCPLGSIGIKLGRIAEGNAEFYLNETLFLGQWDGCAPSLILEEAGGVVFDTKGNSLQFNTVERNLPYGLIALNSAQHKEKVVALFNP